MIKHTGSCYCRSITHSTEYDPMLVFNCHCLACKKLTGASMGTVAVFYESEVKFEGDMKLFQLKGGSGNSVYKYFCENCGCRVMTKVDLIEGLIYVDFGTFDN